jgi:hypothetical protein
MGVAPLEDLPISRFVAASDLKEGISFNFKNGILLEAVMAPACAPFLSRSE